MPATMGGGGGCSSNVHKPVRITSTRRGLCRGKEGEAGSEEDWASPMKGKPPLCGGLVPAAA